MIDVAYLAPAAIFGSVVLSFGGFILGKATTSNPVLMISKVVEAGFALETNLSDECKELLNNEYEFQNYKVAIEKCSRSKNFSERAKELGLKVLESSEFKTTPSDFCFCKEKGNKEIKARLTEKDWEDYMKRCVSGDKKSEVLNSFFWTNTSKNEG